MLLVLPCLAETYVAVVETVAENGAIGRSERLFLTDKLRDRAKKVLPAYMGYVIMTRENINAMLPPGKKVEDCEGECLVETGKNINAHYIAQARVGKFGSQLTLTVELYETMGNNLVGSFTAMSGDAMALLKEIERQADGLFAIISGGNRGGQIGGGAEGFEDMNLGGSDYRASGTRSYIVSVASNPDGAVFSVDGRPNVNCSKTPCDITLSEGSHRFSFGLNMYFDMDTVFEAERSGQKLQVNLMPNFGTLELKPQLQSGVGDARDFSYEIDGSSVSGSSFRLVSGKHGVAISHECYETANFSVNIKSGSNLVFDKQMVAKIGGLRLDVQEDGKPKALPVFVNGNRMGMTPFLETVPVCSKITIGDEREEVPVKLKANETVAYKHDLFGRSILVDKRDGQTYKTVKIGNQVWMAKSLNYKIDFFDPGKSWCYDDDVSSCSRFGRLYNWKAAKSVCPIGWHLPSKQEFETLIKKAGGKSKAGLTLKSKSGWFSNGNDAYGFSALPAGYYISDFQKFFDLDKGAYFWSSTEGDSYDAHILYIDDSYAHVGRSGKGYGYSVRCLKD